MNYYITTESELNGVADHIRTKGSTSAQLEWPNGFEDAIDAISTGTDTTDANATAADILSGKTAYVNGNKVTGNIPSQAAQTITPTTTDQTIASGKYLTGAQTIKGDANLVPTNIAQGVSIFGVQGAHSGGGGGSTGANDVTFLDYDGTIVQSYSASDFANLSAMPANPSHEGLTAQGWNWTLTKAKAHVAKYGKLDIGQMYITDDGKTRVYIHLEKGRTSPMLGVCPNGTVDVDWGDGTTHDTLTGTSVTTAKWTANHNYATPGDYVIKLTVTGSMGFYGSSSSNQYAGLLRFSSSADARNRVYQNAIQRVEIGSGVTSIGGSAFSYCYSLASINIPDGITSIGGSAFQNCYSLASINIPDGITSIGGSAFQNCYSLASINIPDGVTSIGNGAFSYCYSLASINIPDGITSIGGNEFSGCYSLASINIPDGVTSIGNSAFSYCYSLASINIPDGVTSIGGSAFSGCYSLASINIPDGITSIGGSAFQNCYSLASINIPDGITSIGGSAFQNCYSLASINIPDGITSIGGSAFSDCNGVSEYHFASTTPPTLSNTNAFTGIAADCIIYVPVGSLEAYQTATNWSTYASRIQEEPA